MIDPPGLRISAPLPRALERAFARQAPLLEAGASIVAFAGGAVPVGAVAALLGRSSRCAWLRLEPGDARPATFLDNLHSVVDVPVDPDEVLDYRQLGARVAQAMDGLTVLVLEDPRRLHGHHHVKAFARGYASVSASRLALISHVRLAHWIRRSRSAHIVAVSDWAPPPPGDWDTLPAESRDEAGEIFGRLVVRCGRHRGVLFDLADLLRCGRLQLVRAALAHADSQRQLMQSITGSLVRAMSPEHRSLLRGVLRAGRIEGALPSSVALAGTLDLRPWFVSAEDGSQWLKPYWAGCLRRELVRPRATHLVEPPVVAPWHDVGELPRAPVDDSAGRDPAPRLVIDAALLGSFELRVDGQLVECWRGRRGPGILKYLLSQPKHAVSRDVLLELFWPGVEPRVARSRLQAALSQVRRVLRSITDEPIVEYRDEMYRLSLRFVITTDVDEFSALIETAREHELSGDVVAAIAAYERAVGLYRSDFMADSPYDDWTVLPREALRISYLEALDSLVGMHMSAGDLAACARVAQLILKQDPCREDAHRLLMECYARQGRPRQVERQFEMCSRIVRTQLGRSPERETLHLLALLRATARHGS